MPLEPYLPPTPEQKRARQQRLVLAVIAIAWVLSSIVIFLALRALPIRLRALIVLGDLAALIVVLGVLRPRLGPKNSGN